MRESVFPYPLNLCSSCDFSGQYNKAEEALPVPSLGMLIDACIFQENKPVLANEKTRDNTEKR